MNVVIKSNPVIAATVVSVLLAACAAAPTKPEGADSLRSRLTQLQGNPELGSRAPLAMKDADLSVRAAEQPQTDAALGAHLVFVADRKIATAQAQAESNFAVDQRKVLGEQRDALRLKLRTQEADNANRHANAAMVDANNQRLSAESANRRADAAMADADAARGATADAQGSALELQRQIDELQAKVTDRGLVLTLGDVLFASGTANLNSGGDNHLVKLAVFLNKYPERTTLIEGHTDSVGSDVYNQGLSQRRADAVKSYLVAQGIDASRLTAAGKGEGSPVGDNGSATGRQQNRRVEVIIANTRISLVR
jgi:outer membrane protein OmpA-like peptidoglycan-associated protein